MTRGGVLVSAGALWVAAVLTACERGPARPSAIDSARDQCASCRMVISDARTAAQVAEPGEEPRFYDDLVCLRNGLGTSPPIGKEAVVFIVDFRTGEWERADGSVFVRIPDVDTPMASHWVAYSDDPSRRLDPRAEGAEVVPAAHFLAGRGGEGER